MRLHMQITLLAVTGIACAASGEIVTLTFEGLGDNTDILNYYDGGLAGDGTGPGPSYGVQFRSGARSVIDADFGGSGNIAHVPSGQTALFFFSTNSATMNVPNGFADGFGTWYSAITETGLVEVFSGVDGTGDLLATIELPALGTTVGGGDPTGDFNRWSQVGTTFQGVAHSVRITGTANTIALDDITFGGVPAPGVAAVLGGLGVMGARRRRSTC